MTLGCVTYALAGIMMDAHIHRLIVAGTDRRPTGVVSSTDVLAALARTAHECECAEAAAPTASWARSTRLDAPG